MMGRLKPLQEYQSAQNGMRDPGSCLYVGDVHEPYCGQESHDGEGPEDANPSGLKVPAGLKFAV
jgi:hypothetical protein